MNPPPVTVSTGAEEQALDATTGKGGERATAGVGGSHETEEAIVQIPLDALQPNPNQPRRTLDPTSLDHLANSIQTTGVMQPVIVRPSADGNIFQIVAGERRWRAAEKAGLKSIPALIRTLDDRQTSEWALIENLQREDLNPIDRAFAFQRLCDQYHLSHDQISQKVGVDRSTITNTVRLLSLDEQVQELVRLGHLTISQAKVLLGLSDPEAQRAVARKTVTELWPVRRIEGEVRRLTGGETVGPSNPKKGRVRGAHLDDLERQIGEELGTKVRLKPGRKKGTGTLTMDFYSIDHFESLMERFGVETTG